VYVFVRSGTNWTQQAKILASDGTALDKFGYAVSISNDGNNIIISAPDDNKTATGKGSVYIFVRSGSTWTQQTKLTVSDGVSKNNTFGYSVSINNNIAIIGCNGDPITGTAYGLYIYVRSGSTWTQQTKLMAGFAAWSISMSSLGSTIVVGANSDKSNIVPLGYVFVKSGTTWSQQTTLIPDNPSVNNSFGRSVSISADGNSCIIGGRDLLGTPQAGGEAYVFVKSGTSWTRQAKLLANDFDLNDHFGWAVSINSDGKTCVIGSVLDDLVSTDQGSAYIYQYQS
jgi:hypothetical protein